MQASICNGIKIDINLNASAFANFHKPNSSILKLSKGFFGNKLPVHANFYRSKTSKKSLVLNKLTPEEYFEREELRWQREEKRWLREEERWSKEKEYWEERTVNMQIQIDQLKKLVTEIARSHPELFIKFKSDEIPSVMYESKENFLESIQQSRVLPESTVVNQDQVKSNESKLTESELPTEPVQSTGIPVSDSKLPVNLNEKLNSIPAADIIAAAASRTVDGHKQEVKVKENEANVTYRTLRPGAEGDDVKVLQNALGELGFYCGEDDIENDYFSQGTESAVKTWQASIGVSETGIMTHSLLARLYQTQTSIPVPLPVQEPVSKAPSDLVINVSQSQTQLTVSESKPNSYSVNSYSSSNVVYLLGENRWEDPTRLTVTGNGSVQTNRQIHIPNKCIACRGARVLICTECEGSGDLNVEEQFLEWVDENAKCLYCDGTGFVPCDTCEEN